MPVTLLLIFGFVVATLVLALLVARTRRSRLPRMLLAWFVAPFALVAAYLILVILFGPSSDVKASDAFMFGFMLSVWIGLIPWTVSLLLGLGLGLAAHALIGAPPEPSPPSAEPVHHLTDAHVGFAGERLLIDGLDVWNLPWWIEQTAAITRPHPSYPEQRHQFDIFVVKAGGRRARFAAAELSNGVWGFYQLAPDDGVLLQAAPVNTSPRPAWRALFTLAIGAVCFIALATYAVEARLSYQFGTWLRTI